MNDAEQQANQDKKYSEKKSQRDNRFIKAPVVILVFINFILIIIALVVCFKSIIMSRSENLCLSEKCVNTASKVIRSMDQSVNPCTDFYQYSCGGWIKSNSIPKWSSTWDQLSVLQETLMQNVKLLLEKESDRESEPTAVRKARALYKSCMDTASLELKGLEPIRRVLQTVGLTTYPPNTFLKNPKFDWIFTIARTKQLLGLNILFGIHVAEDVRNSSINKIIIKQVFPGFAERYLLQSDKFVDEIQNYKKYITQMVQAYTNDTDDVDFAEDIINFSTEIAKVLTPPEARKSLNHLFYEISIDDLQNGPEIDGNSWEFVDWINYLNVVFNQTNVVLNTKNDTVVVLDLIYLQKLSALLKNTNILTLEKYLWWNVFSSIAPLTLAKFRDLGFKFSQDVFSIQSRIPRWKECTSNVNSNFGFALSYIYVKAHLNKSYQNKAFRMTANIIKAFEDTIYKTEWMDESTRNKTISKLHAIRVFVGHPGWIMNETQLDGYYDQAHVIENNLFETYLNLTNAAVKKNLASIRKKPDHQRWLTAATTVNAFYSATLNSITFPVGILRPPFYDNGIEPIDYGAIGAIMGHEITHGFDDQGRRYNKDGNLNQWWSPLTLQHYQEKIECIVNQYNKYTMPNVDKFFHVHGINTQGENIADNGGLRAAFKAYKAQQTNLSTIDQKLPGLSNFTHDQLFFLGFAQVWCGNATAAATKNKLIDGVHSPNRIRVIGTLSNFEEFAETWNCPIGTSMNPKKKCLLW